MERYHSQAYAYIPKLLDLAMRNALSRCCRVKGGILPSWPPHALVAATQSRNVSAQAGDGESLGVVEGAVGEGNASALLLQSVVKAGF